jgi:predicted oxidoreductase
MPTSPSERSLRARVAAHSLHASRDSRQLTANARKAFNVDRFEREVDPDQLLDPAERARRAEHAKKAYMARLALRSAVARRRAAEQRAADG